MAQKKYTGVKDIAYYQKKFWKIFFLGLGGVFLFFVFANFGLFGSMPSFDELENPDSNLATEIIASDGVILGKFYRENRSPVKFEDLPKHLVDALISTEDERFYEHSGIDARRTFGAAVKLGADGGASTISQQLAKLLFHGEGSRFILFRMVQKVKEWIIATKLERQYTKNEIIALYLNRADFVNTAVGIRSAAKVYFGKEPRDLSIEEGALLIGMLKNPSLFNPVREKRKQLVLNRRNTVLAQMVRNNFLEPEAKAILEKKPVVLDFNPESHTDGIATYFREYLRDYMKKWCKENKKPDGTEYNVYNDGLKIYTTIDSRMQKHAEEAVDEHLKNLQKEFFAAQKTNKNAPFLKLNKDETDKLLMRAMKVSERWRLMKLQEKSDEEIIKSFSVKTDMRIFTWKGERDTIMSPMDSIRYYKHFLQTGMISVEPQTGHVKVWVGGINYKHFQYDHAGQGARQVGSTFKPFVYATAIEQLNMSPCDSIIDSPFTIPRGRHNVTESWTPRNSDGKYRGMITLKKALANSINTVSAKLIDRTGPRAVIDLTHKLGVTTEIPEQPAICLGAVEITVQDMVAAFSTFANKGIYIKPQLITRIEDKNGNVIFESIPETHDVLNQDIAYAVIKLMEGVTEDGTGTRLRWGGAGFTKYNYQFTNPIAGKTGTTQNNSDGWFMGIVPNLCTGVWVGCEDRSARFRSTSMGQGATMALPIWGLYMDKCYKDDKLNVSKEAFDRPKNISIKVDCWKPVKDTLDFDQEVDEFNF
ncbi:transglycosylase domain-containing protein [Flavobacterium sp.]|uniref:penicillin-binding protein 1A n=1 Tax=Flavobacterium sp. TaxID=239 RepID=UPI0025BF4425|nr:transglycosylase domain-containing protein [Flavobacterium sp.]MBA4152800.1 penicillin-binding protein [Flavobacterium sp.]